MCCHDGAWLESAEVPRLRTLVFRRRAELPTVPDRFLVPADGGATKTAVRPHTYARPLPAHFPATRCVFALEDARCALQVLAMTDGVDPWAYKPRACWMHPLRESATGPLPPPRDPAADWDRTDDYPGYVVYTECGRHREDGAPWDEALAAELARWRAGSRAPPA